MLKRIFVEKKKGFDIEAEHLLEDLRENLSIEGLTGLKIINRYDIEGISEEHYSLCKNTIFSEPPVDAVYEELSLSGKVFAVEYLPGQYDQRADSAMQCIQIVTKNALSQVAAAKLYVLEGNISDEEIEKIKSYCINPVDSREASLEKPNSLKMDMPEPDSIKKFEGFILKSKDEIFKMRNDMQLAMSGEDLLFCQKYFKETEKRDPSVTEIKVIDTYWSDHCRHTTFLTKINTVEIEDGFYKNLIHDAYNIYLGERTNSSKNITLMDIATTGMKALKKNGVLSDLDESQEINACSIVVNVDVDGKDEEWLVMFKNETHNHPTEIEPFGGAATCLGGAIRDPLSGRSYVYQAMRVTGSGNPTTLIKDTIQGKLPQRKITTEAAHGYSSYGNQIGLATGLVNEIYHDGYVAKRMEIGAVIGAAKRSHVVRKTPENGDVVILVGGRTGRDGCGGATGSSKEHTEESILTCGAEVQKGNPPVERKLQRLFRNPEASRLIKRCNDFGAGGVSVAIGELSEGLKINLDKVLKKYEGLDGTELAISESQERMAVVVSKDDVDKFIKCSNEENLEATIVAVVTDDKRLKMNWRTDTIVDISREFLDTNGAVQTADVFVAQPKENKPPENSAPSFFADKGVDNNDLKTKWLRNLRQLNVSCQKGLVERFDSTIGAGTVLMPFGGKNSLTPIEAMAAKIPVTNGETKTATLMSYGYNPDVSTWSPFHGAVYAVVESVSKIVATGGQYNTIRLTFQEYFESLGDNPVKWGKPFASLLGSLYAQMKLQIPSIGGKDSMSGTFKDMHVPPTLVSFAVDTAKTDHIISPEFKKAGSKIVVLETPYDEYNLPNFDKLTENYNLITSLIKKGKIISAHTIGVGGIAAAISKMSFGNSIGVNIQIDKDKLFAYNYGSFVLELDGYEDNLPSLCTIVGETATTDRITVNGAEIQLKEALTSWMMPLEKVFPTDYFKESAEPSDLMLKPFNVKIKETASMGICSPRVFIPVFPGTNCEYDTAKAFEKAGAKISQTIIRNLNDDWLEQSISDTVKKINASQMIAIPGGFSAGDEPEGSGKFIAAIFRNPYVKEAVMNLLKNRDGLILGICNGFQALIKLGLLPYGEIVDISENCPTLTFNTIGRHISAFADTKIISNLSPWLFNVSVGDIHRVPFSHGEGRFVCDEKTVMNLAASGQIATQYVDESGEPSYKIQYNPNGSVYAIEGITSPDGRVFGKMGHSERIGGSLYKNISGNFDQQIFEAGVKYFS